MRLTVTELVLLKDWCYLYARWSHILFCAKYIHLCLTVQLYVKENNQKISKWNFFFFFLSTNLYSSRDARDYFCTA